MGAQDAVWAVMAEFEVGRRRAVRPERY